MFPGVFADGPHRLMQTVTMPQEMVKVTEVIDHGHLSVIVPTIYEGKNERTSESLEAQPAPEVGDPRQ